MDVRGKTSWSAEGEKPSASPFFPEPPAAANRKTKSDSIMSSGRESKDERKRVPKDSFEPNAFGMAVFCPSFVIFMQLNYTKIDIAYQEDLCRFKHI